MIYYYKWWNVNWCKTLVTPVLLLLMVMLLRAAAPARTSPAATAAPSTTTSTSATSPTEYTCVEQHYTPRRQHNTPHHILYNIVHEAIKNVELVRKMSILESVSFTFSCARGSVSDLWQHCGVLCLCQSLLCRLGDHLCPCPWSRPPPSPGLLPRQAGACTWWWSPWCSTPASSRTCHHPAQAPHVHSHHLCIVTTCTVTTCAQSSFVQSPHHASPTSCKSWN